MEIHPRWATVGVVFLSGSKLILENSPRHSKPLRNLFMTPAANYCLECSAEVEEKSTMIGTRWERFDWGWVDDEENFTRYRSKPRATKFRFGNSRDQNFSLEFFFSDEIGKFCSSPADNWIWCYQNQSLSDQRAGMKHETANFVTVYKAKGLFPSLSSLSFPCS